MRTIAALLFALLPAALWAGPPMTTVYSSSQSASFNSANFGINRSVNGGSPDNSYTWQRSTNFTTTPLSRHEKLVYSKSHPYSARYRNLRVRRWDDPKVPFEFQNDKYIRQSLALGYFFKPGQRAYVYPAYAR
ncbi:MAG TPA: hypothetical protein VMU88_10230 [bacterium]|nr:hypothetical protein [bacterium]